MNPIIALRRGLSKRPQAYVLLDGAGDYVSTPDSVPASFTGDSDIRFYIAPNDWTPSQTTIYGKSTSIGDQWSQILQLGSSGQLYWRTSSDGTIGALSATQSTVGVPATDGIFRWCRTTHDVDNGASGNDTRFWLSNNYNPETLSGTWVQLGLTVTAAGVTSVFNGTYQVEVGLYAGASEPMAGKIGRIQVFNNLNGNLSNMVWEFNPNDYAGGTTWRSSRTGELWTLNGDARVVK